MRAVYFIQDSGCGYVKIGWATDPWERLADLQCGTPYELRIIRMVEGGQKAEQWFHRRFAKHRIRGEWFSFDEEMLTLSAPDEIPQKPKPIVRYRSAGACLRAANGLGLLSERMKREYKPLLDSNA